MLKVHWCSTAEDLRRPPHQLLPLHSLLSVRGSEFVQRPCIHDSSYLSRWAWRNANLRFAFSTQWDTRLAVAVHARSPQACIPSLIPGIRGSSHVSSGIPGDTPPALPSSLHSPPCTAAMYPAVQLAVLGALVPARLGVLTSAHEEVKAGDDIHGLSVAWSHAFRVSQLMIN